MPRFSLRTLIVAMLLGIVVLPMAYVASYFVLLRPVVDMHDGLSVRRNQWNRYPEYRFGGQLTRDFFHPAYATDHRLRTGYWEADDLPENQR